jgi:hypothetical protein
VQFEEFETLAWRYWEEIPSEYKAGIDGVVLERSAAAHPELPEVYTLGECRTESYPSEYGGPETTRSVVVLYYGSFVRLARQEPEFDWEEELWETLTHELKHHLESLAGEAELEELDYAADENFKRLEGEPFDPFFYRAATPEPDGVWRVEREVFLEREYRSPGELGAEIEFSWRGERYRVPCPEQLGDVCFLWVEEGIERGPGEELTLVLVRRYGAFASLRRLLGGRRAEVVEAEGRAVRVG